MRWIILTCVLSAGTAAAGADIAAHWRFNEISGTTAVDTVSGFNGTLMNGAAFAPGAGIAGGALSLNKATNDYVTMGDIFPFTGGVDFAIQVWVKTSTTETMFPLARHLSGQVAGYIIGIGPHGGGYGEPNKPHLYVSNATGGEARGTTVVTDGAWHQIVGVFRAGVPSIYVDGAPVEDFGNPTTNNLASSSFLIGAITFGAAPTGLYTGLIDDVQVYKGPLCDADVEWLFTHPGEELPECYADCDGVCPLDVSDFGCFTNKFIIGDPYADCNGDTLLDIADFGCFTNKFIVGCP
jgi:hypothetical protein